MFFKTNEDNPVTHHAYLEQVTEHSNIYSGWWDNSLLSYSTYY